MRAPTAPEPPVPPPAAALLDTPHIWRTLGEHGAEIRALKEADAAHVLMLEKLADKVEQVQQHLGQQDGALASVQEGIASLTAGQSKRSEEHRATLHTVRLTLFSTVLSAVVGLAVVGIEHVLIK